MSDDEKVVCRRATGMLDRSAKEINSPIQIYLFFLTTMCHQAYLIGKLPPTLQSTENKLLLLTYEPDGEGVFSYDNQQLYLTYMHQETIVNNTQPEGITKTKMRPLSSRLSCSLWVRHFSRWSIEEENLYSGLSIRDYETDTEREDKYFSGFKFDEDEGTWKCTWEKRDLQQVFNSTFYYSATVELALNLVERVGSYSEHLYSSTAS